MRIGLWISFLAFVCSASAESVTPRILIGGKYCHPVTLTSTWTVDAGVDHSTLNAFREGWGNLEFRRGGPDAVLVSFYTLKYEGASRSRVYSSKKILLPLGGARGGQGITESQWKAAGQAIGSRQPALSTPPTVAHGQDAVIRFRDFDFAATAHLFEPYFAASLSGDWIAAFSWKGTLPEGLVSFTRAEGSMYFDVYRVASGEKTIQVQLDFLDTQPSDILPHAVWLSDRHFVFPINRRKTSLMVCDLGPLQSGPTVWELPSKDAEVLGFREESTSTGVAGTLGYLTLHVGVRVPEAGTYRLSATAVNQRGTEASGSAQTELSAGTNQMEYRVTFPVDADGMLKIRDVKLERIKGKAQTEVAKRDFLGTIGPYKMIRSGTDLRSKALHTLRQMNRGSRPKFQTQVPSPLTVRSLPGKIENLTPAPKSGQKIETLRLKVGVPPVAGQCTWFANLETSGTILMTAGTPVKTSPPPEAILFEFPSKSLFKDAPDGELRLSGVHVACYDEKSIWHHDFDQFPGYTIPGIHFSMLAHSAVPKATFTGKNQVEFLDTNHDGKYEAIKITIGFQSDRKCKIRPTFKDSNGSSYTIGEASYDPSDRKQSVVLYTAFVNSYTSGQHSLEDFDVSCEASDGFFRPATFDKAFRVSLGTFTSEQFQPPFVLLFGSEKPTLEDGKLVYTVNCIPNWTLDTPIEFQPMMEMMPSSEYALEPQRGACKDHATTLRIRPAPDAPPFPYQVSVQGKVANTDISNFVTTQWVKPGAPEIIGVVPNSGSGKRGMFRVAGDDASTGVPKTELLFNGSQEIAHSCHITITRLAISLTDDDGLTEKESKAPNFPPVENSQCSIERGYSYDRLPISFKPSFDGQKTIYARVWNGAGATTGWTKQGTWMVTQNEPPVPISVAPYLAATIQQTFSLTFADPNGAADIAKIDAVFAFDTSDRETCHLTVDRVSSQASLDGGNSASLVSKATITNAQCAISNLRIAEERGRMLRLSGDVRFTPAFQGRRNILLKASDKSRLESSWLWAGSWEVR